MGKNITLGYTYIYTHSYIHITSLAYFKNCKSFLPLLQCVNVNSFVWLTYCLTYMLARLRKLIAFIPTFQVTKLKLL